MVNELLDRLPPCDVASERAVLASVLLAPEVMADVEPLLRPDDFHTGFYGRLFKHMTALWQDGKGAIDLTLLRTAMSANGGWTSEDAAAVAELFADHPLAANVTRYAAIVKGKAEARRIIETAKDILRAAYGGAAPAVLRKRLESATERIAIGNGVDFAPMTLAELMRRDVTIEYLVDGLIAARQSILLAGPSKSLKTSLLLALALALATGKPFLGYFRVLRSISVAVLTGESGLATVKETFARIARVAGIDSTTVTRLIISDRVPHLADPRHLDAIRRLILDFELEMIAVDPAYLALDGGDAAHVMVFGQQLGAVSSLCQEMGVALLVCHHARKGAGADCEPLVLTDVAGAGFAEHFRQWLLVNHRERYDEETATHRLWLNAGGSAGHGGLWGVDVHQGRIADIGGRIWDVTVQHAAEVREAVKSQRHEAREAEERARLEGDFQRVLEAIHQERFANGATAADLRAAVAMSGTRFNAVAEAMLQDGSLEICEVRKGNRKQTYRGYRLAQTDNQARFASFESD